MRDEVAEIPVPDILLGFPGERGHEVPLLLRRARKAARRLEEAIRARDRHPAARRSRSDPAPGPIESPPQHGEIRRIGT
jgi:hypothetical protein